MSSMDENISILDDMDLGTNRGIDRRRREMLFETSFFNLIREVIRRIWYRLSCKSPSGSDDGTDASNLLDPQKDEFQRLRFKIIDLENSLEGKTEDYRNLESHIRDMERRFKEEKASLLNEIKDLEVHLQKLQKEIEEMRAVKDDALSRLSEMMGAKLRDNNPAITDLNDPNRPMKLCDQLNELYENEWTETFLDLQHIKFEDESRPLNEEDIIKILLQILREINNKSIAELELQLSGVLKSIEGIAMDDASHFIQSCKDMIKMNAGKYIPMLNKKIIGDGTVCQTVAKYAGNCQSYIESCVKVCYFAAVQNPPMYLDFEPGEVFDRQVFKEYTATGTKVRFLVWPALFLHKGGAVLSKGVVQPIEEATET